MEGEVEEAGEAGGSGKPIEVCLLFLPTFFLEVRLLFVFFCAGYGVHCTVFTVRCSLYTVQSSVNIATEHLAPVRSRQFRLRV